MVVRSDRVRWPGRFLRSGGRWRIPTGMPRIGVAPHRIQRLDTSSCP